jgi:hypothetical protein
VRRVRALLRENPLNTSTAPPTAMDTLLISLLALGCLAYLVMAVLRPENF